MGSHGNEWPVLLSRAGILKPGPHASLGRKVALSPTSGFWLSQ